MSVERKKFYEQPATKYALYAVGTLVILGFSIKLISAALALA